MRYYFAPMEGITGFNYRNAHYKYFPGIDKYYTPFISPDQNTCFSTREKEDIIPQHNEDIPIVPQIMTNNPAFFTKTEKVLREYGYEEVNLNLGCPSATVVTKKKGSGFLAYPQELDEFLYEIFQHATGKISIKTRLGIKETQEFQCILDIYNKYDISELIIHPRVQKDFYKNAPHMELFQYALTNSKNKICYNGDLFEIKDEKLFERNYSSVETVMIGRGLLRDPTMVMKLKGEHIPGLDVLRAFHDEVYIGYENIMSGQKNVLFRMKELWSYFYCYFSVDKKHLKKILKAQGKGEYLAAVNEIFLFQRQNEIHL